LKGAHWEIETDWHIEAVTVWRRYMHTNIHIHFTNPVTVLALEALALFFGEEYVREKKLGDRRN
jgi:hypothetical protein